MKYLLNIALTIAVLVFAMGCSDTTAPAKDPNVIVIGEMATRYVNIISMIKKNDKIQANEVDSIKIIRIRLLFSDMKLFADSIDTTVGKVLKTGPFVYDINETNGISSLANSSVPSGVYEKIKFEFHRLSANEANQYANDPVLKDFATTDRYSVLIEGITYKDGNPTLFNFKAQITANLSLKFDPALNFQNNTTNTISLQLDPNFFFKKWESILDPNDPKNANDIENTLINTIKAIKK